MKFIWKGLGVAIRDSSSLKIKNVSTANALCALVQLIIVTDHIWKNKYDLKFIWKALSVAIRDSSVFKKMF